MNIRAIRQLSVLLCIGAGIAAHPASAQEQRTARDRAEVHYLRYEYRKAAVFFEEAANRKFFKTQQLRMLADCYRQLDEYDKAAECYRKITESKDALPADFLHYGDALKSTGDYTAAKEMYARYREKGGMEADARIAGCDSAIAWMADTPPVISNLRDLNTAAADWGATWNGDGQLVFTSDSLRATMLDPRQKASLQQYRRTGNAFQKLYTVDTIHRNPDATAVRGFDNVLNDFRYHVGPVAFSPGGDTAFITVTSPGKPVAQKEGRHEKYRTRRLELFVSVRGRNGWQAPAPFAYNNPQYSIGHAAVSADGKTLYFTADMPGGQGQTDIWFCEQQADGAWSAPKNCGGAINTPEEEAFPTVNEEGWLYFSSKGHPGMGGFDLFVAEGAGQNWGHPINLKSGYNSPGDDFHLKSGPTGIELFASNRKGGMGGDDLYGLIPETLSKPAITTGRKIFILETSVFEQGSEQPAAGATVMLTDENRNDSWTLHTQDDGKAYMVLTDGHRYVVSASGPGNGWSASKSFTAGREDTVKIGLHLQAGVPRPGDVMHLVRIYFDRDGYRLRPESLTALDSLAEIMDRFPGLLVELGAHTDSRHTHAYNITLSERRAAAAADYLVNKGIGRERLKTVGYGESRLTNNCADGVECTEAAHQQNRRLEARILKR
ncbi:OmpA family protein [Chitinophaga rhizosphaerae]|uniref:OmpA family protein n=1 Tax=Chitinophaga rhizosphaerae TaxID=1864947 RepID=UPI000F80B08E|nr:OmpA family protein [Chitinophaga rhizosphaerae]